jgi:hypothetical protein
MTTTTKQALSPNDLRQFTGTEHYYKHAFNSKFVYTDGVRHFAQNAGGGAYWFLDIMATEVYDLHKKKHAFLSVKMTVIGTKAQIKATDGNDKVLWERELDFTDCPEGEWEFFMIHDGQQSVMLVTSEY